MPRPTRYQMAREKVGLTQEVLAAQLGVSVLSVHRWESSNHAPKNILIRAAYLKAIGLPPNPKDTP